MYDRKNNARLVVRITKTSNSKNIMLMQYFRRGHKHRRSVSLRSCNRLSARPLHTSVPAAKPSRGISRYRKSCCGKARPVLSNGTLWAATNMKCAKVVVGISMTRHRGSNTAELDDGWKLSYSGVEPANFAQAAVGILVSTQLASFVDEWILLRGSVSILRFMLS